jgi:hypothetical protein
MTRTRQRTGGTLLLHCNSVASTLACSAPEGICWFADVFFTGSDLDFVQSLVLSSQTVVKVA